MVKQTNIPLTTRLKTLLLLAMLIVCSSKAEEQSILTNAIVSPEGLSGATLAAREAEAKKLLDGQYRSHP